MALSKTQKKYLVGICHHLQPVVMLGQKGLTENVLGELEIALDQHELVKVKLRGDREERARWIDTIVEKTGAELVLKIGQVGCFFRRNAEKPQLELPR